MSRGRKGAMKMMRDFHLKNFLNAGIVLEIHAGSPVLLDWEESRMRMGSELLFAEKTGRLRG